MSDWTRRGFMGSAAAAAGVLAALRAAEAGDPSFQNNVPDPELAGKELPTFKFELEKSEGKVIGDSYGKEATVKQLPISKGIAGVSMRLEPGAIRELHWHKEDEWSLMLNGAARITCVDGDGRNFVDDVKEGDLWYFPSGLPHSIQALEQGCEFLLVFDDGSFSEDSTFLISQWFAHVPKEVLAKNFRMPQNAFDNIPKEQLYIFQAPVHPYTRALLAATPSLRQGGGRAAPLAGEVPSIANPPSGCVFRTRCPMALPACAAEVPPLRPIAGLRRRQVACLRADELTSRG